MPSAAAGGWDEGEWEAAERSAAAEGTGPARAETNGSEPRGGQDAGSALSLDEAVARVPAPARRQLEELFRGRFVAVKRIRREELR